MKSSILYFFSLVLKVSLDLALDIVYKEDGISKVFLKKDLKFLLGYKIGPFLLNTKLILLPTKVDSPTKE